MLTTTLTMPSTSINSSRIPSPISDTFDDNPSRLTTYLHQLAGCYETEINVLAKDHCYARPWNWKPENVYVKPIKKLFFSKKNLLTEKVTQDEEINIEEINNEPLVPPIDFTRVRHQMDELQRLANFARPDENEDWEEKLDKILWTPVQNRIFTKVLKILNSERLTRLAKVSSSIEPIYRRTSVDTAARRFRETLASVGWDWRLAQWLHNLLFDHLPQEYLGIYLDILQSLRLKIPQLIDKMIAIQPNINAKTGSITWETLGSLLKRTWDPVTPSLNSNRLKKLPGNPILIIVPSGVGSSMSTRQHKWISQLGALGMVVTVHTHLGLAANRMTMMVCIDQLLQATRTKIQDIRSDCPGRPIILVGFNTGAALACQVAQMEHVTAVICLGFSFLTVEGKRGTPDDTLMDIRCPVMFVIGQNATLVRPDDIEDLRERMMVETSFVVVGTADDHLRISTAKKISEGITQNMVDRCILDEIGDFVGTILLQPHPLPLRSTSLSNYENKNNRKESRKRRNSTSSSVESEPNSPTIKKSRPNTPISSVISIGQNTQSATISRVGTFSTQQNIIAVSGIHTNHVQSVKRKPRVVSNQKSHFVEHLITSRLSGQPNSGSDNGGITLNIGSLASLAPIGPIRLAPASSGQSVSTTIKNIPKSSIASTKVPKIVSTNVQLQNMPKMKAIVSSGKGFSKVISNNYRHLNIPDKNGDTKLVNVLTSSGNQIRVNTSTAAAMHNKPTIGTPNGTLSNILQNGKTSLTLTTSSSSARISAASSILLTPNNSVATNTASTTSIIPKVMDDMATTSSSSHLMLSSTHSLDTFKMSQIPRQVTTCNNNDISHNAVCGNIIMVESSLSTKPSCSSVIVPLNNHNSGTILPLSNKLKVTQKSTKSMPKITVNASNLQRIHKSQTVQKNSLVNEIDDELGNILDIPIIFAKDDDNLNSIEKSSSLSQTMAVDIHEKTIPKLNSNTKVVLISNKQDKLQQSNKFVTPCTQAVLCPNVAVQNLNHVILQTNPQTSTLSKTKTTIPIQTRSNQPTVKYTKIILAKRNSQSVHQNDKNEQVIVTKTVDKINASKLLNFDKNEHRYAQIAIKQTANNEDNIVDEALEIEDAIKMNIIERKHVPLQRVDLSLQTSDKAKESLTEAKLNVTKEDNSECIAIDDVINLQI
ncbi:KAT8 regulatory NSL complex subunit 3 [Bombus huntii]|uniref:KAT8 regulatory NSL complex subunit 3 n=1 Tax=Bombus huntii TaxID=85661 RepID=UPI0021AAA20C|nr:KAT8 regulatory NSL complex subunit 3 [Bombus huntii]XP_050483778.1 KAT8 regulatory NSL complex subunit 3 [Bombus huntii]XP_050483779.1 KAT8 regulatory NSL complex subunit 3 [Bombus huntii]XP_050483780.1 KAT8 regulatory NSL complex subunit 3 [Bombus huntii]